MDPLSSTLGTTVQARPSLASLRRHQRRLLFGGGGLVSLLIVATLLMAVFSDVDTFHAEERQRFVDARSAVDYFLFQRDRAYASNINGSEMMWNTQQPRLKTLGAPLADRFLANGGQLLVRAEGRTAVPWLVLGAKDNPVPRPLLDAYMGIMHEYSVYTAASVAALRSVGPVTMYFYEPKRRLLAVSGVTDEAQLLRALRVSSREEAFTRLLATEARALRMRPAVGPVQSAAGGGRMVSTFDANPITGQPSLVALQLLQQGREPILRRVAFEPVDTIKARLDARESGAYTVITDDGRTVLRSAGAAAAIAPALARRVNDEAGKADVRFYQDGQFVVAGPVAAVDWRILHTYGWGDLWHDKGHRLLAQLLAATLILAALWWVLLRLDRRVFMPALADAWRVYESEALSRVIIDTSPVGLVLIDPESGEPLVQNELARQMADAAATVDGQTLHAALADKVQADAASGQPVREFLWSAPVAVPDQPALRLQVAMALAAYRDRAVWVCALRDVTAQAELEQTLRSARHDAERARAAAESASRAKSAFVATMSHEIRTPLNGVLGHLELLARSPMQPAQRERVARIRLSADALLGIISDVLDFSKIEAGQLDIDPVAFTPRPLIEQAALLFAPEAQRKGVKLFYAIAPELERTFLADMHRIRQVLNNLLGNAVKFTESGRIVVRAQLLERPPGAAPMLRLQVVDSGIGLGEEALAQLFQPFQQADASISRRYGGSGLGLALCQQLARLLGGSIRAESTLGVGSVFTFEVPVQPEGAPVSSAQPLRGRRITLLSAAAEWRHEIAELLQRWGAEVTVLEQPPLQPLPHADTTLLLFGERRAWTADEENALAALHRDVVRASPNGPLSPQPMDDGVHVSSYAADALLRALNDTVEGAPAVVAAAPVSAMQAAQGRVLLVEDNAVNRELIQQQLETLGLSVDTAENGSDGLLAWRPDVHLAVLTDINMPVMDGYALARALRARDSAVPILAITATALASERERCRAAGISDLLLKPMNLDTLARALEPYLVASAPAGPREGGRVATQAGTADPPPMVLPDALRRTFVTSTLDDLQRIAQARLAEDHDGLLDRLHAVKGVLMMLGHRALGIRFGVMEGQLRDGVAVDGVALDAALSDLRALVDQHAAQLPTTAQDN
ncbi:hybrid sensor histidine kinase/response regulator [Stenotrophomonas sp. CFBP 13718]|uniref:hybrid sensor histidine kinase/response regulator n=1 Tax=Stenotrophomonas sp. CFBP 13718 TaxID=2775304 RepID=UPI0020181150|nr:hybrid sensor histidine kinase/response regulator [Stenotrophomonas sp. CFBP 13718]